MVEVPEAPPRAPSFRRGAPPSCAVLERAHELGNQRLLPAVDQELGGRVGDEANGRPRGVGREGGQLAQQQRLITAVDNDIQKREGLLNYVFSEHKSSATSSLVVSDITALTGT
mgnify:CR=1 FL=1